MFISKILLAFAPKIYIKNDIHTEIIMPYIWAIEDKIKSADYDWRDIFFDASFCSINNMYLANWQSDDCIKLHNNTYLIANDTPYYLQSYRENIAKFEFKQVGRGLYRIPRTLLVAWNETALIGSDMRENLLYLFFLLRDVCVDVVRVILDNLFHIVREDYSLYIQVN